MATQVGGEKADPITTKNIGQNFPSFRRRNKPTRYSVEGPRVSALPKFLPATSKGASRTGRHPFKPPKLSRDHSDGSGSRFRIQHQGQSISARFPPPSQLPLRILLAPVVTERSLSIKERFSCPCRIWISDYPRNCVGQRSLQIIHFTHGGASE